MSQWNHKVLVPQTIPKFHPQTFKLSKMATAMEYEYWRRASVNSWRTWTRTKTPAMRSWKNDMSVPIISGVLMQVRNRLLYMCCIYLWYVSANRRTIFFQIFEYKKAGVSSSNPIISNQTCVWKQLETPQEPYGRNLQGFGMFCTCQTIKNTHG